MAIHAPFLISPPRVDHIKIGQHGPPLIGNIEKIPVALLALLVLERGIGNAPLLLVVIFSAHKMNNDVLYAMGGLCIEKIERICRRRQVAIHAIGHKSLGIVGMGGGLPGVVGKLNFMAGRTELGGGVEVRTMVK